jgi:hypothetical protein
VEQMDFSNIEVSNEELTCMTSSCLHFFNRK